MKKRDILHLLESIATKALGDQNYRTALAALQLLGREQGLFQTQKEQNLDLENLSDDELSKLIQRFE